MQAFIYLESFVAELKVIRTALEVVVRGSFPKVATESDSAEAIAVVHRRFRSIRNWR